MNNSLELTLKLHSLPNKKPEFLITIDNEEIKNYNAMNCIAYSDDRNLCTIKQELDSIGPHNFAIVFSNKINTDTLVDENNNVVGDLAIEIDSVKIDDVDITHEAKSRGIYKNTGSHNDETYGYMYTNGTFTLDFITPIFLYKRNLNLIK